MATNLTSGNDAYIADGGEVVNALQGNDQINIIHTKDNSFLSLDFDYFTPAEVHGNQGDDTIISHGFGDRLYGDSDNDWLYGGGGRDQMFGGSGDDTIWTGTSDIVVSDFDQLSSLLDGDVVWAGSGDDTVHLENADNEDTIRGEEGYDILHLYNNEGHITQFSLVAGGSNAGLLASGFEELHYYGGAVSEVVEGGESFDSIYGNGGTDLISGNGAADWLAGEDGADFINGGDGSDFIYGGNDDDILRGDGGGDLIDGGSGDDSIEDGKGADVIQAGRGNDTIRTGEGRDSVYGGDDNDTIREIGEDYTFYTSRDGTLVKIPDGDTLRGEGGDDNIQAGTGKDQVYGGSGNDTLDGGAHGDLLDGGAGYDTVTYASAASGIKLALDGSFNAEGDAAGDTFVSIDKFMGSYHDDVIRGDAGANAIRGNGGDDAIDGMDGNDVLVASSGADALRGGIGSDSLFGRAGNDKLVGGLGADALYGEGGDDQFIYSTLAEAGDAIADFSSNAAGNNDVFKFNDTAFGGLALGAIAADQFQSSTAGTAADADVRFFYETDTRILRFDADGSDAGAAVVIATLQAGAAVAIGDISIF